MQANCRLCGSYSEIRESHIIPRFIFSWFKKTSPTYIRGGENPNKRLQDGDKEYWLCDNCEQIFSAWETHFSKKIYYPIHEKPGQPIDCEYDNWCIKFLTSVVWRVAEYYSNKGLPHFDEKQINAIERAKRTWKRYLLGEIDSLGEFQIHLIPVDLVENGQPEKMTPFLNRYLVRSTDMDVVRNSRNAYVYVKLVKFLVFGFILVRDKGHWRNTKISMSKGFIGPKSYSMPGDVWEYILDKSAKMGTYFSKLSDNQKEKVREAYTKNSEKFKNSELFQAISQDILYFGDEVFVDKTP